MPKYLYPLLPLLMWAPRAPAQGPRLATLTSAAAVHNLSQAEARRGYPVELRLTALACLPTWLGGSRTMASLASSCASGPRMLR